MIGVVEEAEVKTLESLNEFHRILLGLYGRVLRVQLIVPEYDYGGIFYEDCGNMPARDIWKKYDRVGRLIGLELTQHRERIDREVQSTDGTYLSVKLEGIDERIQPELNRSLIEVLQEDTGEWTTIHRSSSWQQDHETLELTA